MNERVMERAAEAGRDVSSPERMIGLLDLFEEPAQRRTFDQIHTRLDFRAVAGRIVFGARIVSSAIAQ
jgi:hypothetical protein